MKLKLDKFTWIVLALVAILLVAAVVTVSRSGAQQPLEYRTDDSPEAPVVNAFIAFQKGDMAVARRQYSAQVLKEVDSVTGYGPLRGEPYYGDASRRLRLIETNVDDQNPDRAYVSFAIDNYSTGGLFNQGQTWSTDRVVEVIREDGAWKINAQEFFY
ncbi:MAG: hypothetical protein IPK16_26340 [Anaerolineales bacterium]|nr:hypothetical protein [Anaerolineales bacterium]